MKKSFVLLLEKFTCQNFEHYIASLDLMILINIVVKSTPQKKLPKLKQHVKKIQ